MKEEQKENELLIPKIGEKSDFKAINNGTIEDLKQIAAEFIQKYI